MEGAYIEDILESRRLSDEEVDYYFRTLNLPAGQRKLRVIEKAPEFNSNHFFRDCQRKGNIYSQPQAHTHQTHWKKQAEEAKGAGVRIINLSKISKIKGLEAAEVWDVFSHVPKDCCRGLADPFLEDSGRIDNSHIHMANSAIAEISTTKWKAIVGQPRSLIWGCTFPGVGSVKGRELVAGVQLASEKEADFSLRMQSVAGRGIQGTVTTASLRPGETRTVTVSHNFTREKTEVSISVSAGQSETGELNRISVFSPWITETLASVMGRYHPCELTAQRAREAASNGNHSLALAIWKKPFNDANNENSRKEIHDISSQVSFGTSIFGDEALHAALLGRQRVDSKRGQPPIGRNAWVKLPVRLLLDPEDALPEIEPGGLLHVDATALLSEGGPDAEHFARVRDWAYRRISR